MQVNAEQKPKPNPKHGPKPKPEHGSDPEAGMKKIMRSHTMQQLAQVNVTYPERTRHNLKKPFSFLLRCRPAIQVPPACGYI